MALTNTSNVPRQSFLSTDFFVATSEESATKALAFLPGQDSRISLVKETAHRHSTRFLFQSLKESSQIYIDVSILPLNEMYVRFILHGQYTNEKRIEDGSEIELALSCFEKSVYAALEIDYPVKEVRQRSTPSLKNLFRVPAYLLSMISFKEA